MKIEGMIAGVIGIFLLAVIMSDMKRLKRFEEIYNKGSNLLKVTARKRRLEQCVQYVQMGLLILIGLYMMWAILYSRVNQHAILIAVVIYLIFYYWNEYLLHSKWCMNEKGILTSRVIDYIAWENIVSYRSFEGKKKNILRLNYKGKGIMTRKCDLLLPLQAEKQVMQQLEVHHIRAQKLT